MAFTLIASITFIKNAFQISINAQNARNTMIVAVTPDKSKLVTVFAFVNSKLLFFTNVKFCLLYFLNFLSRYNDLVFPRLIFWLIRSRIGNQ